MTLTAGQRNTLERIAWCHRNGLEFEGTPAYFKPRGGQSRICSRWEDDGFLTYECCSADDGREVWCYGLTDKGVEWAKSLGVSLLNEEPPLV